MASSSSHYSSLDLCYRPILIPVSPSIRRSDVPSSLPACLYTCLLFYSCCIWTRLRLSHLEEGGRPAVSAQSELTSSPVHLFFCPSLCRCLSLTFAHLIKSSFVSADISSFLFNDTLRQPVRDVSLSFRPPHQSNMQLVSSTEASHAGN